MKWLGYKVVVIRSRVKQKKTAGKYGFNPV
jgi:hypothetical protein